MSRWPIRTPFRLVWATVTVGAAMVGCETLSHRKVGSGEPTEVARKGEGSHPNAFWKKGLAYGSAEDEKEGDGSQGLRTMHAPNRQSGAWSREAAEIESHFGIDR